jgi:hypothetical protein
MKTVLCKAIVGVRVGSRVPKTLPSGAEIEISRRSSRGRIEISWNGSSFSVFREDLLGACEVSDMWRVSLLRERQRGA